MKYITVLCLLFAASIAAADTNFEVSDPQQVDSLQSIQTQIDLLGTAVMTCLDTGKTHNTCLCENAERIQAFNLSVTTLFQKHPEFKALDLVSYQSPEGMSVTQSLHGIKRQAGMVLSCP